jgi:CheY-like chemotaxis protein
MKADQTTCFTVLMAEDDPDDRFLIEQVFRELESCGDLRFVEDGEELIEYLVRSGKYADPSLSPRPSLILLDLNMPKKDGRQALVEIKKDPELQKIPVVVWTTSNEFEDKRETQKAGASAYVTKPLSYAGLVHAVKDLVAKYSPERAADKIA